MFAVGRCWPIESLYSIKPARRRKVSVNLGDYFIQFGELLTGF
jgi:hypothetical protein